MIVQGKLALDYRRARETNEFLRTSIVICKKKTKREES